MGHGNHMPHKYSKVSHVYEFGDVNLDKLMFRQCMHENINIESKIALPYSYGG